ncbi:MAG: DNA-directed RNA polymerase subunit L [Desulfurococcaceae archaeon]
MDIKIVSRTGREIILEIKGEDHTLGNILMREALRHPAVEYASYRIPHPLRDVMEFTLIVKEGADISTVLREVLGKLREQIYAFRDLVEKSIG